MRRLLCVCLCLGMLICGCAAKEQTKQDMIKGALDQITPERIAGYIVETGCGVSTDELERLDKAVDEQTLAGYITEQYGLESGSWTDCAIYRRGGASAFEVAVLRLKEPKKAEEAVQALTEYIHNREGDFTGYEPEQAQIVHDSEAAASEYGDVALFICRNVSRAASCFQNSYEWFFRVPFDPPGEDDMTVYDDSAVVEAWRSGDSAGLSEEDAAILELASQVYQSAVTEDMTPYEREAALYGWITENVRYDQDHYDALAQLDPDSSNPYGPLHNHKGICIGYATTFQLLMDMAQVECITVVGAAFDSTGDHAWNMVRLNDQWYCADPTWDEGSAPEDWDYFNVTSEKMTGTDHQWDYENVPEAVATDGGLG